MRVLSGLNRVAMAAICIAGAVACGDDDNDKDKTSDSGQAATASDGGGPGSGFDGAVNTNNNGGDRRDATVLADGRVLEAPDSGSPAQQDAAASLPCGGSCDDGVNCTIDTCVADKCQHRVDEAACAAGSSCSLTMGCQQGKSCANPMDCADMDGCTVEPTCNTALGRCEYAVLDVDKDGYPPASCGGTDCNDDRGLINPSATEICDGVDNDCDGMVDEDVKLATGEACTMGKPACAQGYARCGNACVSLQTDVDNCGACGTLCGHAGTCTQGACSSCNVGGTVMMCELGAQTICSDTATSSVNCGGCNMPCTAGQGGLETCIASACTTCGGDNQPCCSSEGATALLPNGCLPGLACEGTRGTAASKCTCGGTNTKCEEACVDLKTDALNCGACGMACNPGEVCTTEGGSTSCKPCGGAGERCCTLGPIKACLGRGLACGPNDTCVTETAGGPGGVGPGGFGPGGFGPGGFGPGGFGPGGFGRDAGMN